MNNISFDDIQFAIAELSRLSVELGEASAAQHEAARRGKGLTSTKRRVALLRNRVSLAHGHLYRLYFMLVQQKH